VSTTRTPGQIDLMLLELSLDDAEPDELTATRRDLASITAIRRNLTRVHHPGDLEHVACHDYLAHQRFHRQRRDGSWWCAACLAGETPPGANRPTPGPSAEARP
jgi:hypothetical protein